MKQKEGFCLRTVCGEHIIVAEGLANIDFSSIISLNDPAAFLWEKALGHTFTVEDMTQWLMDEYEVDESTAREDAASLAANWLEIGIVEP